MTATKGQRQSFRIRGELLARGFTATQIAKRLGRNKSTVSRIIRGKERSRYIESAIAQILGRRREDLFPDTAESRRLSQGGSKRAA